MALTFLECLPIGADTLVFDMIRCTVYNMQTGEHIFDVLPGKAGIVREARWSSYMQELYPWLPDIVIADENIASVVTGYYNVMARAGFNPLEVKPPWPLHGNYRLIWPARKARPDGWPLSARFEPRARPEPNRKRS